MSAPVVLANQPDYALEDLTALPRGLSGPQLAIYREQLQTAYAKGFSDGRAWGRKKRPPKMKEQDEKAN